MNINGEAEPQGARGPPRQTTIAGDGSPRSRGHCLKQHTMARDRDNLAGPTVTRHRSRQIPRPRQPGSPALISTRSRGSSLLPHLSDSKVNPTLAGHLARSSIGPRSLPQSRPEMFPRASTSHKGWLKRGRSLTMEKREPPSSHNDEQVRAIEEYGEWEVWVNSSEVVGKIQHKTSRKCSSSTDCPGPPDSESARPRFRGVKVAVGRKIRGSGLASGLRAWGFRVGRADRVRGMGARGRGSSVSFAWRCSRDRVGYGGLVRNLGPEGPKTLARHVHDKTRRVVSDDHLALIPRTTR